MKRLQYIRKMSNLTQNQLVIKSGLSRSLITKYESGEKNINKASGENLYKLAKALNCSIEDLLELDEISTKS